MIRGRLLALILALSPNVHAEDYCLALRGNGELMPAHWGAMANLAEKVGLPVMQAGGSSASLTMMLNEAVASNKFVAQASVPERNLRAAILYKSLEGYVDFLKNSREWQEFSALYQKVSAVGGADWMNHLEKWLSPTRTMDRPQLIVFLRANLEAAKNSYQAGKNLGLLSETNYSPLMEAIGGLASGDFSHAEEDVARARFYLGELREALRVFGQFDAENDANLFFRPGLVNFELFGEQFGRLAQFYSAAWTSPADETLWKDFFAACGGSRGQAWDEIIYTKRECRGKLEELIKAFESKPQTESFAYRAVGLTIPSFPSTTIITAVDEVKKGFEDYAKAQSKDFGFQFFLRNPESVRFGYWGTQELLRRIDQALPKSSDEKSRRFYPIGQAKWERVLALSPAEPGLAKMQTFEQDGRELVSAGGWSDLQPVTVLRAAGCERVIYVTRRGVESPFARGVAKRILSRGPNDPDVESTLDALYDLDLARSSFRHALDQADAVLCTDWNRFNIRAGVGDMIRDSYRKSPFYVRNREAFKGGPLLPQLNPNDRTPDGKLVYEGCF